MDSCHEAVPLLFQNSVLVWIAHPLLTPNGATTLLLQPASSALLLMSLAQ
jgi:hypothetical protein